jgi:serine/threonine protein kinase
MTAPDEAEILRKALALPLKERPGFLDEVCGGDAALRERILRAIYEASNKSGAAFGAEAPTEVIPPGPGIPGEKPGDMIGRFRLLEPLGEGGMGMVWLAEERGVIRRKVALKVIKPRMDEEIIARFEAERQIMAMMEHSNIAKVFDAGATEDGRPYYAMELVRGDRITDHCKLHRVPTRERLGLFVQVCKAIQHVHERRIIHRDIKPPNILVATEEGEPTPKIIDFGIAKALTLVIGDPIHTWAGDFIGTPAYMAPEQAKKAANSDIQSDLYSLGVLLYEVLTGETPFPALQSRRLHPDQVRRILEEEEPEPPSARLTKLDPEGLAEIAKEHRCEPRKLIDRVKNKLDCIVMKCLEKDPARRYESATALAREGQRCLKEMEQEEGPAIVLEWLGRWMKRNRRKVWAGAGTVLLMVTCMGVGLARRHTGEQAKTGGQDRTTTSITDSINSKIARYDETNMLESVIAELVEAVQKDQRLMGRLAWAEWLQYEEDHREATWWEANRCATNATNLNPYNSEAWLVRGLLTMDRGDLEQATEYLNKAVELSNSVEPIPLTALASALAAKGDGTNAQRTIERASKYAKDHWDFDRIGSYYSRYVPVTNGFRAAQTNFQIAVQLATNSPLAHRHLGQKLLGQRLPGAKEELEKSRELRVTAPTLIALGQLLRLTSPNTAAALFEEAVKLDPRNYISHVGAGIVLSSMGATNAALAHFEEALILTGDILKVEPEKPLVLAYHGYCLSALSVGNAAAGSTNATSQKAEALSDLSTALKKAPHDNNVLVIVKQAYLVLGDQKRYEEVRAMLGE